MPLQRKVHQDFDHEASSKYCNVRNISRYVFPHALNHAAPTMMLSNQRQFCDQTRTLHFWPDWTENLSKLIKFFNSYWSTGSRWRPVEKEGSPENSTKMKISDGNTGCRRVLTLNLRIVFIFQTFLTHRGVRQYFYPNTTGGQELTVKVGDEFHVFSFHL